MRRFGLLMLAAVFLAGTVPAAVGATVRGSSLAPPDRPRLAVGARGVELTWRTATFPRRATARSVVVRRDGQVLGQAGPRGPYRDAAVGPGQQHSYTVTSEATIDGRRVSSRPSSSLTVTLPNYYVGAATADITPSGVVNLGGFGLGDGRLLPDAVVGRGGRAKSEGERIRARAMVIDDGQSSVAIADIETQGMFAAYEDGPWGLTDMAARVARDIPALADDHIIIATDHTHSGPDTIGAWGGVPDSYLHFIADQTVAAIEQAYRDRQFADVHSGQSEAADLIYNQSCTEALNQSAKPDYTGPSVCATPGKDGTVRVLQARTPAGKTVVTFMAYAAHGTAGGGQGLSGDWPQFLSDAMAATFGGVGLAMEGAIGGTQPCRPSCAFTNPANPGYRIKDRKTAILANYMAHVRQALSRTTLVAGPVGGVQQDIREPITGPAVLALFVAGKYDGAELLRSHKNPWVVGTTIRTVVSAVRVGTVLFAGTPGEGFPAIGSGIRSAVGGAEMVVQLGLANDQLGYLISPASYVPIIAAQVAVNDNIIFNVSPTIGDHVMCTQIGLAQRLRLAAPLPPACAGYAAQDAAGDPVAAVPIGGVTLP